MSRHSKNNTASCIFTYGERLKLKSQNEWGDISARLGSDSQKKFEQCGLCLKIVDEPLICQKGHLFCKCCVIENLFHQKAEIKKNLKEWEENNKNRILAENNFNELNNISKKEDLIITVEDKIAHFDKNIDNEALISEEEIIMLNSVEKMKKTKQKGPKKDKSDSIKNCFWIPEKTPESFSDNVKKPSELLECPMREKDHYIKLKELIKIKLIKNSNGDKFMCSVCEKEFNFQKIITIKKCGDTMCKKCFDTISKKDSICSVCNEKISLNDIINLRESGTCYSQHNIVSTSKLNPYFKY